MNKRFGYYFAIWAILFAAFNLICLITPESITVGGIEYVKTGGAFWTGFAGIDLAFVGQLICAYIALKDRNKGKVFYNIPVIRISYTGLILTIIFGVLAMAIPDLPSWIAAVVCLLICMFTAIAVIKAKAAASVVVAVSNRVKNKTEFIKNLTVDAESLVACAKTDETRSLCQNIAEAVRFSDPMSDVALTEIEMQIEKVFKSFSDAVNDNDTELAASVAGNLNTLIVTRNKKCKLLK